MKIADFSIRRPVTTLTITAAVIIFGLMSYTKMGIDLFPEVDTPVATITTTLLGASPEVIDTDVTDVIEEQVKTLSGIKTITSQSYESFSQVVVEFELEKDGDIAVQEVRDKVNLAERNLPDDVEKPVVQKFDINSEAFMWVSVYGDMDYATLSRYADDVLKEQLQSVSGVGNVQLGGMREREIRVWLDPDKLRARGLTAQDVVGAIKLKHVEMPGGRIETDAEEYTIKVLGEYGSVDELKHLVVADMGGSAIRLTDLGEVNDSFEDQRSVTRYNGKPSIGLGVRKQSGTNTVAVSKAVRARLAELTESAPEGVKVDIAFDLTDYIQDSIKGVEFDILFGILLTALVMYFFLRNLRITFISIMAIPVSLIGSLIVMQRLGFTLNLMTMLAMSLAVGMVIDDTIVVLENIFRHVENGMDRKEAARKGTDEVGLAVIAATSSIAAVFLPVAFMKGIIGRYFFQFGLTVALTIIISVFVSLTLTPFLCSRLMHHQERHGRVYQALERFFVGMENGYRKILEWATGHRWSVVIIAVLCFVGGLALVPLIGTEMAPQSDDGAYLLTFELPTGTSLKQAEARLIEIENEVYTFPEVDHAFTSIGMNAGGEVNRGGLMVSLVDKSAREADQDELMARTRKMLKKFPDMTSSVAYMGGGGSGRTADVTMIIQGPTLEELASISQDVVADLNARGVFQDVDTNLRLTKPDVKVKINRGLADDLGVNVQAISSEIYTLFGGVNAAKFKDGGKRYDIRVKALPQYRLDPANPEKIAVRAADGRLIDAGNLITAEVGSGPNVINRHDRMRSVTIYADCLGIAKGDGLKIMQETINKHLPEDGRFSMCLTGESRTQQESFKYLLDALILAILMIYMILCIQFESFLHPFTMMLSLPLCMVGVFGALLLAGMTLNIFSFIGIIMLMGIVTKNGILLVDFANQQREEGMDKVQAMINAGTIRLRPILMTALTVVASMIPLALGLSDGGETRAPMGMAIMGGMVSSTLLTLIVVPVVYIMLDNAKESLAAKRHRTKTVPAVPVTEGECNHG